MFRRRWRGDSQIIPVPRILSSSCGYAVLIEGQDRQALLTELAQQECECDAVYEMVSDAAGETYEKLPGL